jgi:6-phosphogluconolactonase
MSTIGSHPLPSIFDNRRQICVPGNLNVTLQYCIDHFLSIGNQAIEDHGFFSVALSGGATPRAIYQGLSNEANRDKLDWTKVFVFWSDERSVPPTDPESNYRMAMESGLQDLLVPENVFRMKTEGVLQDEAVAYENMILKTIPSASFDLIMLGIGEDGHTASLFPETEGLESKGRLVISNYIPQRNTWRMTFTFDCINRAQNIVIYALGKNKRNIVNQVLYGPYLPRIYPIQEVGTASNNALWIMDTMV